MAISENNRQEALEDINKVIPTKKIFSRSAFWRCAGYYALSAEDQEWLYRTFKKQRKSRLRKMVFFTEDGTGSVDRSRVDYNGIYDEIIKNHEGLTQFINKVRNVRPEQIGEISFITGQIRKGNAEARERLLELYLRLAVRIAYRISKALDIDLEDAIGDACVGLMTAVSNFDPDNNPSFYKLAAYSIYRKVLREQRAYNRQIDFSVINSKLVIPVYKMLKKRGCLSCEKLAVCDETRDEILKKCHCSLKELECVMPSMFQMLSLEEYLETADRRSLDGFSDGLSRQDDDAPIYEEELSSYYVDATDVAEGNLSDWLLRKQLDRFLYTLSDREEEVLVSYYGLRGEQAHSLNAIGAHYGVSGERIRQNKCTALKKLKSDGNYIIKYL